MDKIKEQKIVVILSLNESDSMLMENGIRLATIFKKELCLLIVIRDKNEKSYDQLKLILENYKQNIRHENPGLIVSHILFTGSKKSIPESVADDEEAILIVVPASAYSNYSGALAASPVPFFFVDEKSAEISTFNKIMLGIDLRTENKDSALWSSYFGRFNQSEIVVVAANDRSKEGQHKVAGNLAFMKELYKKFKLKHTIFKGTKSSLGNSFEALDLARSSGSNLLIILGSSTITPLDWLIGLPERKIVKKAGTLPVLIVNPRIDNYILCD